MIRYSRLTCASLVVLVILLAVPVASYAAAGAWPMFGHDGRHSRRSPYLGPPAPTLKWAADVTVGNGWVYSSPAVGPDGTVYITADDFSPTLSHLQLYGLDPATGAVVWQVDAGDTHGSSPAVASDGTVYVGSSLNSAPSLQRGRLYAFTRDTTTPKWQFATTNFFHSSPALDAQGNIYIGCDDSQVWGVGPSDGLPLWGYAPNGWSTFESSPAVDGAGALYIGCSDQRMYSLYTTVPGGQRWVTETIDSNDVDSSPAVSADGQTVYFVDDGGRVYALNGGDGKIKWSQAVLGDVPPSQRTSSPGLGADGTIYVGGYNGRVYALDPGAGATKWSRETGGPVQSSPAIGSDGTVYIGSDDGKLYALDGGTGAVKWTYATDDSISSSPAIGADGTVYVASEDGFLYAIGGGTPAPKACTLSTPKTSGALRRGVMVTYSGALRPRHVTKVTLTFQRKRGGAWKAFSTAKVSTKATGVWTYKKKLGAAAYRLRASTAASSAYKAATSKWKTVVIR